MAASRFPAFSPARHGVTLIELLVALALAILLLGAVYGVYRTATQTLSDQQRRHAADAPTVAALDRLSRDLTCAWFSVPDPACTFRLEPGDAGTLGPELTFCTLERPNDEPDPMRADALQVTYQLVSDEKRGSLLVRAHRPLSGPGSDQPPRTNSLVAGVQVFRVRVFDGIEWHDAWPTAEEETRPCAARIELQTSGRKRSGLLQTDVLIPAGMVITARPPGSVTSP